MRGNYIYIFLCFLLALSCQQEKEVVVDINPIQVNINGNINRLREQLKNRNTTLVYENSYEGEEKGVSFFYFDDENDSLQYHFEVYTINDKIKGIEVGVFSNQLSTDELYSKVEQEILADFKSSANYVLNAEIKAERSNEKDGSGYYKFEIKTGELQTKIK